MTKNRHRPWRSWGSSGSHGLNKLQSEGAYFRGKLFRVATVQHDRFSSNRIPNIVLE
jgi:hypothetical protein